MSVIWMIISEWSCEMNDEKIRMMLNMADPKNGGTADERANALRMAHREMDRGRVSYSSLGFSDAEAARIEGQANIVADVECKEIMQPSDVPWASYGPRGNAFEMWRTQKKKAREAAERKRSEREAEVYEIMREDGTLQLRRLVMAEPEPPETLLQFAVSEVGSFMVDVLKGLLLIVLTALVLGAFGFLK
jgi:hypothetical protein